MAPQFWLLDFLAFPTEIPTTRGAQAMETRQLRRMLRRARNDARLTEEKAGQLIAGGPNRNTVHRWETVGNLQALRYALALGRRSPSFALRLLFDMDPTA